MVTVSPWRVTFTGDRRPGNAPFGDRADRVAQAVFLSTTLASSWLLAPINSYGMTFLSLVSSSKRAIFSGICKSTSTMSRRGLPWGLKITIAEKASSARVSTAREIACKAEG